MSDSFLTPDKACQVDRESAEWPEQDRERWRSLFGPSARFGGQFIWAEATRRRVAWVYRLYLRQCLIDGFQPEIAPEAINSFAAAAWSRGCTLRTVAGYVECLWHILPLLRPGERKQLGWLRGLANRLHRAAATTPKQKAGRQRPAGDILNLGLAEMETSDLTTGFWHDCKRFRDGLILALWICMPERRRAFTAVRLQDLSADLSSIDFPAEHQKTGEAIRRIVPEFLRPHLRRYLEEIRSVYAGNHDRLWIVEGGDPAGSQTLYRGVRDLTERGLGIALSPHRLRDCAARFVVEEMTSEARLASVILNHRDERSIAPYLEGASTLAASRKALDLLNRSRAKTLSR